MRESFLVLFEAYVINSSHLVRAGRVDVAAVTHNPTEEEALIEQYLNDEKWMERTMGYV